MIVYNPLAGGLLTGKHAKDEPPRPGDAVHAGRLGRALPRALLARRAVRGRRDASATIAGRRGLNLATVSVAWVLAQPGITSAIVGASRPEQLADTLAAPDLTLDDETRAACDAVWWTIPRR